MSIKYQKGSIPLGLLGLLLVPVSAQAIVNPVVSDPTTSHSKNDLSARHLVTNQVSKIAMLSSLEEQGESGLPKFPTLSSEVSSEKKVEFILASNSLTIPLNSTSEQVNLEPNLLAENRTWENPEPVPLAVIPPKQEETLKPVLIPVENIKDSNYSTTETNSQELISNSNNPTMVALESTTNMSESIPLPVILPSSNSLLNSQPRLSGNQTVTNISSKIHKVQPKENLNTIAREYGIRVEDLIKANNIEDPNLVKINQTLIIPSSVRTNSPTLISSDSEKTNSFGVGLTVERQKSTNWINVTERNPISSEQVSSSQAIASSIPLEIEFYNPANRPSPGEIVSPDLPQLDPPEQYLPESRGIFNGYIWPAKGVLTSGYGWRWGRMHKGIDIAGPVGTPIFAAADGEVVAAGWNSGGFGNLVKIKHFDGSLTLYAHNSKIFVRRGQVVTQGQQIAALGSTGRSTGPHLHFEVHPRPGQAQNPMAFLPRR